MVLAANMEIVGRWDSFIEKKRPRTNSVMNEMVKQNKKTVVEVKLYISRVGIRKSING